MSHTLWLFVAPSGAGKTTLVTRLKENGLSEVVSHVTRDMRPGEVDGVHYHFITRERFEAMEAAGEFIEKVDYGGNFYGVSCAEVESKLAAGDCVAIVNGDGADQLRAAFPCKVIFLAPPDIQEMVRRLRERGDSEQIIQDRLASRESEMAYQLKANSVIEPNSPEWTYRVACYIMDRKP